MALKIRPNAACIVPEKREEVTTEGGLAVIGQEARLADQLAPLKDAGIKLSLFVEANQADLDALLLLGRILLNYIPASTVMTSLREKVNFCVCKQLLGTPQHLALNVTLDMGLIIIPCRQLPRFQISRN